MNTATTRLTKRQPGDKMVEDNGSTGVISRAGRSAELGPHFLTDVLGRPSESALASADDACYMSC